MRATADGMKVCSKCRLNREVAWFSKHKGQADGLQPYCKECKRARAKANHMKLRYTRPSVTTGNKTCSRCKEVKDISLFRRTAINKDGRRSSCKACEAATFMRRYNSNLELYREKQREASRKYYWESDGKLMQALYKQDKRKEQRGYL